MRKSNWLVVAIAAVAAGLVLWAWYALGFNHVDDPLDLVVAIVWWLVMPDAGETEVSALERTLAGMAFPDEVTKLDERVHPTFRWVVRSRKFDRNGEVWEGEVLAAHDPDAEPRPFASREDLAALLAA